MEQGDYGGARVVNEESLAIRRALGDKSGIAACLLNLGNVAREQEDYASARILCAQSLMLRRELEDKSGFVSCLEAFASLATKEAQEERCTRLWGAAAALRETIGSPQSPVERKKHEREMTAVRQTLNEDAFAVAWAQGHAMTMEQAIEYALEK